MILYTLIKSVKNSVQQYLFRYKWRKQCSIPYSATIGLNSVFEGMNKIGADSKFKGYLGYGSYIGMNCVLNAKIGKFCSVSRNVVMNSGVHPYKAPFVTTAPCFYALNPNKIQNGSTFAKRNMFEQFRRIDDKYSIEIGNDVWIGDGVFFVGGIHIANGAMVLARATVTKDVPPYAIVGGTPAKIIGYRYDEETIKWLLEIQWWNNTPEWFNDNWELLCDIEKLKEHYVSRC